MGRNHGAGSIALGLALLWPGIVAAGEVFTGFQIDSHSQYYAYSGVRVPISSGEQTLQPFVQLMGAGLGYTLDRKSTRLNSSH